MVKYCRGAGLLIVLGGFFAASPQLDAAEQWRVKVLATYPHDAGAFTQGLLFEKAGEVLLESTGQYGKSSLRRVEAKTGRLLQNIRLDTSLFGEGLAKVDTRLVQLTWENGVAIVWDAATLTEIQRWSYEGEGWGLTFDGNQLIQSDGSAWLKFRDPNDFSLQAKLEVKLAGVPVPNLNELEFADGKLYANIWGKNEIVRVDPQTGEVEAVIQVKDLLQPNEQPGTDVLNGIAWDEKSKTFWITGKLWPKMFQVVFEKAR